MNDALLIQQATGVHTFLLNLTIKDHADYCRRHQFDYWPIYGTALTGKDAGRHAFWEKVALLRKGMEAGYKHVVWLDSDCYIADATRDLREACPDDGFGLVWHGKPEWPEGPGCYDHFNCGAIYVGSGFYAKQLLNQWWMASDDGHFWHDQHAFNAHAVPNFERFTRQPAPITKLGYEWNSVPFKEFVHERPVVAAWHGYQRDVGLRLDAMQEYIQQNRMRVMLEGCSLAEACQKADYCMSVGNLEGALQFFERAQELGENGDGLLRQKAACYYTMKRHAEAAACYLQVLEVDPTSGPIWQSLSSCYDYLGEHEMNGEAIREAEKHAPNYSPVMHNKALYQLRDGQWAEGFEGMKWQFLLRERISQYPSPEWQRPTGIPKDWKGPGRLFIWAEQGLGDTLMLSRYLAGLTTDTIIWSVQPALVELFKAQCWPGIEIVAQVPEKGIPFEFDAHVGMFTLPHLVGETVERARGARYIRPPFEKVREWSEHIIGDGLKVGFSWAGSRQHGNNHNRNMTAGLFDDLVKTPGTRWYSLQRDIVIPDEAKEGTPEVTWIGDEFEDMADTAGALANLDLVITVDSAIAHLAGAMGIPCWTLLSKSSDWRWLLDREDTVWYESMRLFRQDALGDWEPVMARVTAELEKMLANG